MQSSTITLCDMQRVYEQVMADEGAAHPGEIYDPVFGWWIPDVCEPGLRRFFSEIYENRVLHPACGVPGVSDALMKG